MSASILATTSSNTRTHLFIKPNQSTTSHLDLQSGTIRLINLTALKVYRVAQDARGLFWGEIETTDNSYSLPLGKKEEIPEKYWNLLKIEIKDQPGFAKFIHESSSNNGSSEITFEAHLLSLEILTDAFRDGGWKDLDPQSALQSDRWIWGEKGVGAVIIPNVDRDITEPSLNPAHSELAPMHLPPIVTSSEGLNPIDGYSARLSVDPSIAEKITVYQMVDGELRFVLGKNSQGDTSRVISSSDPLGLSGGQFYIESHGFANMNFNGLISINLSFLDETNPDSVKIMEKSTALFRVSPWMMIPNTSRALKVQALNLDHPRYGSNKLFLNGLKAALDDLGIPLQIIAGENYHYDRWVQDEFEVGFAQDARHNMHVVFDLPRDRGLDDFPEDLVAPDFGHTEIKNPTNINSLNYGGNLEVSPPVIVGDQKFPFGRIIYGGPDPRRPMNGRDRRMVPQARAFLSAQRVQAPIELYSDWLAVGHVDEFMTFVPDDTSPKGFKLILASVHATRDVLQEWHDKGFGDKILFKGLNREHPDGPSAEERIDTLLENSKVWEFNELCQNNINLNREILKRELGLDETDIIDAPVLFKSYGRRAVAYFPDMVNHLVIGNVSVVPKPYGAVIQGKCIFERALEKALPNRIIRYIDDWYSYHEQLGEVHCGTNVVRAPLKEKWWDHRPALAEDI